MGGPWGKIVQDPKNIDEPPWPEPRYAWYVVGVLTVAYTFSFVDRQILALLVGPIRRDLGISYTQISLLQGLAFAIFYTLLGVPIGRLADRKSRRGIIAIGIAVWSVMTAACGLAKSYGTLFLARMGVGVGEAALSPPAYSIVADYFPPEKLARALSFYSMGIYIGAGLAFIMGGAVVALVSDVGTWDVPIIGEIYPWQMTFFAVGLPGLLVVGLMATVKEPLRRGLLRTEEEGEVQAPREVPLGEVMAYIRQRWKAYGLMFVGISMMSMMGYGTGNWAPEFVFQTYGMATSEFAFYYGSVVLIFATSGIVCGGWIAERLLKRGYRDANLRVIVGVAVLTIPFGVMAPLASDLTWLTILGIPLVFMAGMPFGVGPAAIQIITPNQIRGQVSAIYLLVINIIGLGGGPFVVAWITDYVFGYDQALGYALSILHGVAAPIAVICVGLSLKYYRELDREAQSWRYGGGTSPSDGRTQASDTAKDQISG